jgi:hypothetical protein
MSKFSFDIPVALWLLAEVLSLARKRIKSSKMNSKIADNKVERGMLD